MKFRQALMFLTLFGCATQLTEMPKEYSEAEKLYTDRVKKDASFLLNCKGIDLEPAETAYIIRWSGSNQLTIDNEIIQKNQLRYTVPISYYVSGCDKRLKFILVSSDRKEVCMGHMGRLYTSKTCVPMQDSSLATK